MPGDMGSMLSRDVNLSFKNRICIMSRMVVSSSFPKLLVIENSIYDGGRGKLELLWPAVRVSPPVGWPCLAMGSLY